MVIDFLLVDGCEVIWDYCLENDLIAPADNPLPKWKVRRSRSGATSKYYNSFSCVSTESRFGWAKHRSEYVASWTKETNIDSSMSGNYNTATDAGDYGYGHDKSFSGINVFWCSV